MFIYDQYFPKQSIPRDVRLSWYCKKDSIYYGLDGCRNRLLICKCFDNEYMEIVRAYSKISFNLRNKVNFAVCHNTCRTVNCIYILDDYFREIGCLKLRFCETKTHIEDIWFDQIQNILLVVTALKIYKYNLNGDNLGAFMMAPKGRSYKSICTFGNFIFIVYESSGCQYVASYTATGVFLETLSLGNEYATCNMQVITGGEFPILHLFGYKNNCFPYIVEVALEGNPKPHKANENVIVECCNDDSVQMTCYVENRAITT